MGLMRRFGFWLSRTTKTEHLYLQRITALENLCVERCGEIFRLRCALTMLKEHESDPDKISFIERALR